MKRELRYCKSCKAYLNHTFNGVQIAPGTKFDGMEYWTCEECRSTAMMLPRNVPNAYTRQRRAAAVDTLTRGIKGRKK